jgi:hypothetical protein
MNYHYIKDFHKSREAKIGASDIPHLIPHPEIQTESLAAYTKDGKRYPCTALDLYNEKLNPSPWEYNFPAEMGHYLEGRALYEFISDNISHDIARDFLRGYQMHKMEQDTGPGAVNPEPFNNTPFKHNTEAVTDYGVAHGDCLYDPTDKMLVNKPSSVGVMITANHKLKINNLTIDLSKPFLIQAKSANNYSVQARKHDQYRGYDLDLLEWQGLPLKVYFQEQYEMLMYNVDMAYVALIYNTNSKHYWQIKVNKKHQRDLIQIASYMKTCIDNRTPPRELLMNSKDIAKLYPEIKDDFREVQGEELTELLQIARERHEAADHEKRWKSKKDDCDERMSIHLRDTEKLKGVVGDRLQTIAVWSKRKGAEKVMALGSIKKLEGAESKRIINYLKKNNLITKGDDTKSPKVVIKVEEL